MATTYRQEGGFYLFIVYTPWRIWSTYNTTGEGEICKMGKRL